MSGGVYLIKGGGELVEMKESAYDSEDVLQELLAKYPNLLAGDQMDSAAPRRWLLISREMGVPAEEEGGGRWSVDHLFLDQDAIPTLVEVKRSSDTRVRREVVGQMLDDAANAVVYWPVEAIRARYEKNCEQMGLDPAEQLSAFLDAGMNVDEFWQRVKTNLQAGRVRMVFVADAIPAELRRIVEFLNGQMDPAQVLAVEIKQFVGQELKTLVPRVLGQTVEAERKKASAGGDKKPWDEAGFFVDLEARCGADQAATARKLLAWAKGRSLRIWWGRGAKDGSFFPMLDHKEQTHWLFCVWTYGRVEVQFQHMLSRQPFGDESRRRALRDRLNQIPGVEIPEDRIAFRPAIPLAALGSQASLQAFLDVFDWYLNEIRAV